MFGMINPCTMESGMKTKLMDWERMCGQMADGTTVSGLRITCTGRAHIRGRMAAAMKATT